MSYECRMQQPSGVLCHIIFVQTPATTKDRHMQWERERDLNTDGHTNRALTSGNKLKPFNIQSKLKN